MHRLLAFFCVFLFCLAGQRALADPAMWVVRDADSTVYLMGTIHILRDGDHWSSPRMEQAFAASEDLWLETLTDQTARQKAQAAALRHGLDPKNPLRLRLTAEDAARVKVVAQDIGLPWMAIQPYRPWLLAVTIALAPAERAGYRVDSGVDYLLQLDAERAGKPIRTFETPEQQIAFFGNLPAAVELAFLRQTLADYDRGLAMIDSLIDGWLAGDIAAMEETMVFDLKERVPQIYDVLLVRRNHDWVAQIETLMAGAGTHFIAVGGAHLVGEAGLPSLLAQRNYAVTRY